MRRGVATGGARGTMAPTLISNQTSPNSFIFKRQGYYFLWVFRNYTDQKFHDFYSMLQFYIYMLFLDNSLTFILTTKGK